MRKPFLLLSSQVQAPISYKAKKSEKKIKIE
jgi:hypothetical protein